MYQDLDILKTKLPSGGTTALWTDIVIGIEGYDSKFWSDSKRKNNYWDTTNYGGPRFDIHFDLYSIESQKALF